MLSSVKAASYKSKTGGRRVFKGDRAFGGLLAARMSYRRPATGSAPDRGLTAHRPASRTGAAVRRGVALRHARAARKAQAKRGASSWAGTRSQKPRAKRFARNPAYAASAALNCPRRSPPYLFSVHARPGFFGVRPRPAAPAPRRVSPRLRTLRKSRARHSNCGNAAADEQVLCGL